MKYRYDTLSVKLSWYEVHWTWSFLKLCHELTKNCLYPFSSTQNSKLHRSIRTSYNAPLSVITVRIYNQANEQSNISIRDAGLLRSLDRDASDLQRCLREGSQMHVQKSHLAFYQIWQTAVFNPNVRSCKPIAAFKIRTNVPTRVGIKSNIVES